MDNNLQQQQIIVVAGVAMDKGRFFVGRRGPGMKESGKWEFPGGKINQGEPLEQALRREIKEELNVDCRIGEPVGVGYFPGGQVIAFRVEYETRPMKSADHDELRWVTPDELFRLPLAVADYSVAVAALRHKVEVDRFGVGSVVRLFMGLYFLAGLMVALGVFIVQQFMAGYVPTEQWQGIARLGLGAVFMVPVLYAVLGAVVGVLIAGMYNVLSWALGGILLEIRRK